MSCARLGRLSLCANHVKLTARGLYRPLPISKVNSGAPRHVTTIPTEMNRRRHVSTGVELHESGEIPFEMPLKSKDSIYETGALSSITTPDQTSTSKSRPQKKARPKRTSPSSSSDEQPTPSQPTPDSSYTPPLLQTPPTPRKPLEEWQTQKAALSKKFPQGWSPRKRLSPDALSGIRALHARDPATFSLPALSAQFKVSPEAVRRILRAKWRPTPEEEERRRVRWDRRGERIWRDLAELGTRPPRRWREMGVGRVENKGGGVGGGRVVPGWKRATEGRKKVARDEDVPWATDG